MVAAALLALFLPIRCAICRRPTAGVSGPCPACAEELLAPPALPPPPGVDRCHAVTAYEGVGRDIVAALKFRGERGVLAWVAAVLATSIDVRGLDVVTWIPATGAHRRQRGRDPAERLAGAVAAEVGVPLRRLLVRLPGPPQAGRGAVARRAGPGLAAARRAPGGVLVVDDVVTTGGSAAAAGRVLRGAGARRVVLACAARTPPGRHA